MLFFVFINLVAGMTYYNLLSPMILARSGYSSQTLAFVNGAIGLGGILITFVPSAKNKVKAMFLCTGLSFILGDTLLAVGNSVLIWSIAGFLSSVFLLSINANWRSMLIDEQCHSSC